MYLPLTKGHLSNVATILGTQAGFIREVLLLYICTMELCPNTTTELGPLIDGPNITECYIISYNQDHLSIKTTLPSTKWVILILGFLSTNVHVNVFARKTVVQMLPQIPGDISAALF